MLYWKIIVVRFLQSEGNCPEYVIWWSPRSDDELYVTAKEHAYRALPNGFPDPVYPTTGTMQPCAGAATPVSDSALQPRDKLFISKVEVLLLT